MKPRSADVVYPDARVASPATDLRTIHRGSPVLQNEEEATTGQLIRTMEISFREAAVIRTLSIRPPVSILCRSSFFRGDEMHEH